MIKLDHPPVRERPGDSCSNVPECRRAARASDRTASYRAYLRGKGSGAAGVRSRDRFRRPTASGAYDITWRISAGDFPFLNAEDTSGPSASRPLGR